MLQFINGVFVTRLRQHHVSIHLMLQFILPEYDTKNLALHVSIHLMLQFISTYRNDKHQPQVVSIHLMLQFILNAMKMLREQYCFNTSHVVVYQDINHILLGVNQFQYISCCSLSLMKKPLIFCCDLFQYISCCSLSSASLPLLQP